METGGLQEGVPGSGQQQCLGAQPAVCSWDTTTLRGGPGRALLVAHSRPEFGQVEGSQVPGPAISLKRKWLPLTTPSSGARPLQWGLGKGRLHAPGAPLGRVDLEPLLSAGDDMLRVELETCVKGVACSRPGMKRMDRPLCVCRQTGRLKDMGGEQQHPGQSSQCVCARPRVEKAPLKTAEGSRVEALEPFSQVR